ncbi:MAG: tRNA guanosine(34) transglycosylase Tgt [Planctomycetota bacterium]
MPPVTIDVHATDGSARTGVVTTPHGRFPTPAFMPVGTQGCVKGITPDRLRDGGAGCVLGNTYHLMLRPGEETVAKLGGLQRFGGWNGPMLTDSGGFQVFSLADQSTMTEEGVTFRSHLDGSLNQLTPERSMRVQNQLGADIIMAFDHCPAGDAPRDVQLDAMERTTRWLERCVKAHARPDEQALFGIVQGGVDLELRAKHAEQLAAFDLPGYALGGLAVGEGFEAMQKVLASTTSLLPAEKPRYLMGVGYPRDIVEAVSQGVDMFDCVLPTRNGRGMVVWTTAGETLRLKNARFADDDRPIDPDCDCYTCQTYSRGALRHFYLAGEMLGPILASLHNLAFYGRFMADLRTAIAAGRLDDFRANDPRCHIAPADSGDRPPHKHLPSSPAHDRA